MSLDRRTPLNRATPKSIAWNRARSRLNAISPKQRERNRGLDQLRVEIVAERGPYCEASRVIGDALADKYGRYPIGTHSIRTDARQYGRTMQITLVNALEKCRVLGSDLHHILPRGRGGKDEKSNLLFVCRSCHDFIDHEQPIATELGLLRKSESGR